MAYPFLCKLTQVVTSLSKEYLVRNRSTKIKKKLPKFRQFNGSVITTFGQFETTFEAKEKFEIILIIVDGFKNHGLIGTNVLKIETAKLINKKNKKLVF